MKSARMEEFERKVIEIEDRCLKYSASLKYSGRLKISGKEAVLFFVSTMNTDR